VGISERQLRRWRKRLEEQGHKGLLDRRRGTPSRRPVFSEFHFPEGSCRLQGNALLNEFWESCGLPFHYYSVMSGWPVIRPQEQRKPALRLQRASIVAEWDFNPRPASG